MDNSFASHATAATPDALIGFTTNMPTPLAQLDDNVDIEGEPLPLFSMYVPKFRDATVNSAVTDGTTMGFQIARNFLLEQNWITSDLLAHMEQYYPDQGDIAPGTGIRDPAAFQTACSFLFQKGRIYASSKQLTQVVTLFLDKWGAKSVCLGKKICCCSLNIIMKTMTPKFCQRNMTVWT